MLNQSSLKSKKFIPTRQHKLNSSLKCIVNRQVTCNKCKIPTNLHSLVKCMACKRYYCLTCTDGTDYIDYICNSCFGEIKLNHLLNLLVLVIVCTFLRSMVISYLSRSCFNVITKIHFFYSRQVQNGDTVWYRQSVRKKERGLFWLWCHIKHTEF